jgi:hypothetical protein
MTPYQRGYDAALSDIAAVATFVWTYTKVNKGELFRGWNAKAQVAAVFASAVAVGTLVSYVLLPVTHFVAGLFSSE